MLNRFTEGFTSIPGNHADTFHVHLKTRAFESLNKLGEADLILIAFPIYFHSMPGQVKAFMEAIPNCSNSGQTMVFLIQCGFPDTAQCLPMQRYVEKWATRKGYRVHGTIVKGFGPSLEAMPARTNTKWLHQIFSLGQDAGACRPFPERILHELSAPATFSPVLLLFMRLLAKLGIFDLYSKRRLRKNKVSVRNSYARPLLDEQEDTGNATVKGKGAEASPR
ncbi:NAD(P)H-dependent oxidoreductase [Cohnella sp. 56]|uniref:NAD(P)H-dependent oxidoreductase n=1 Tax=Cohnella sp. 56 TaxID=3113722 RepID=UPI0030E8B0C6